MSNKTKSSKFYVQGMHCNACELIIERTLKKDSNVADVNVSLSEKTVEIKHNKNHQKSAEHYNALLSKHGYSLNSQPVGAISWDTDTIVKAMLAIAALVIVYLFLELQGYLKFISINESSSLFAFFIFGIVAGVSSCAALVGGLLLSLSKHWNNLYGGKSMIKRAVPFSMFNIGRLVSYALLGGVLGALGAVFQISLSATAILVIGVSAVMIVLGLQMLGVPWVSKIRLQLPSRWTKKISNEENFQGKYMPFAAGALTFFLPCGFTLLAQTVALASGSFVAGSSIMLLFALGTLIPLIFISFSSIKFQTNPKFSGAFNLTAAILIIVFGLYNINSQLLVLGLPNFAAFAAQKSISGQKPQIKLDENGLGSEIVDINGEQVQNVYMKATGFEYLPKQLNLTAGIPTTLTIENEQVIGCAQAMYLKGLYDDVVYLNTEKAVAQFTPEKGTYYISCTMGMVEPVVVNVY